MKEVNRYSHGERPTVSVCIATYQGERYIKQQLESILRQLRTGDEVNIVDDASTDSTRELISSINDPRVRLIQSSRNRGALLAFESAVKASSGDVIFLSDQDDEWLPAKVSTVLDVFAIQPDVRVIASDASVVDDHGEVIEKSYYKTRGGFTASFWPNIVRCSFLGATMAFRRSLLQEILPFPANYDVLHDLWIGMRNTISGKKTYFIDEPLILYRRHSGNLSRSQSLWRKIRLRINLLAALSAYSIKRRVKGESMIYKEHDPS
jgi:glycosyltransferase involved in cell wall biosynthesis